MENKKNLIGGIKNFKILVFAGERKQLKRLTIFIISGDCFEGTFEGSGVFAEPKGNIAKGVKSVPLAEIVKNNVTCSLFFSNSTIPFFVD